jgi:hypothetical protein
MRQYIFLTAEGTTFQPDSTSSEPDIENMQVLGFAGGDTVQDAAIRLVGLNEYLTNTNFDEIFAIQLADNRREYFSLRDVLRKSGGI